MLIQGPVVNRDLCFRAFLTSNSDSSPQNWSRVKWALKKNDFEIFWNFLITLSTIDIVSYIYFEMWSRKIPDLMTPNQKSEDS